MDRPALQRRLEDLVLAHRWTIALVFPLAGAGTLVATAEGLLPAPAGAVALLLLGGTLVMRLPLIGTLLPLVDRRAAIGLLAVAGYAYGIELVGLATGWPYGAFRYLADLGPMVGGVPVALPLFFVPLVVNGYLLAVLLLGRRGGARPLRLGAALAVVLAVDLVLDPGAVAVGFWTYLDGGSYYGVPASNYAGWLLSGTVAVVGIDLSFHRVDLRERARDCAFSLDDLVSFVLLWGAINAAYGQWIPVVLGGVLGASIRATGRIGVGRAWRGVGAAMGRS